MNKNLNFKIIKSKLIAFNEFLKNEKTGNKLFEEQFPELENILLNYTFTKKEKNEIFKIFDKNINQFQDYYSQFVNRREFGFAKKMLKLKVGKLEIKDFKKTFLYPTSTDRRKKEIVHAKISKKDKILFIGSGPIPRSAIMYHKYTGCEIDCFEQCKEYADISKKIIEKFGLSKKIKVYNRKGQSLGKNSYALIVIALVAEPKNKILLRIKNTASSKTKIMYKTAVDIHGLLFRTTDLKLFNGFKIIKKIYSEGYITYYLTLIKQK